MTRPVGILTNLYSLTSRLYVGLTSFTLCEGAPSNKGPHSKHCTCSKQHKPMVGLSETNTWPGYRLSDHSILQLHESLSKSFRQNCFVGIDSLHSLPDGSSSSTPILRFHKKRPPSQTLRRLSAHSSRYVHRSSSHGAHRKSLGIVQFLKGTFSIVSTAISSSPGQSELLKCCYSHSSSFPGGDALAKPGMVPEGSVTQARGIRLRSMSLLGRRRASSHAAGARSRILRLTQAPLVPLEPREMAMPCLHPLLLSAWQSFF